MSPGDLLTLVGLMAAVFALVTPEQRLDVRLLLGRVDWLVLGTALLAVHAITYRGVLWALGVARLDRWPWGLAPDTASYSIILLAGGVVWLRSRRRTLPASRLPILRELAERQLNERNYPRLLYLLERHLVGVRRALSSDFVLSRFRRRYSIARKRRLRTTDGGIQVTTPTLEPILSRVGLLERLALKAPSYEVAQGAAQDIVRRVLLSGEFIDVLASARPELALRILDQSPIERTKFVDLLFAAWLRNPSSPLYHELRNTVEMLSGYRYQLRSEHRILAFFLTDIRIAEQHAVYNSVGRFALDDLDRRLRAPEEDDQRQARPDFEDVDRWQSPAHAAIRFFDIMIPEALHQGVKWHMWLNYMPLLVQRFVRNLAGLPDSVDLDREWPTPYHYLIYESSDCLRRWVRESYELDPNSSSVRHDPSQKEWNNIPGSAILALGEVLRSVLQANHLTLAFRTYMLEVVLRLLHDLRSVPARRPYDTLLEKAILSGGDRFGRTERPNYRKYLTLAFEEVDISLRIEPTLRSLGKSLNDPYADDLVS